MKKSVLSKVTCTVASTLLLTLPWSLCAEDNYADLIDQMITAEQYSAAREKLSEAREYKVDDEELTLLERRLLLLESMEQPIEQASGPQHRASQMVNSLRRALESGKLTRVKEISKPGAKTTALLDALYEQYTGIRVKVSYPLLDPVTGTYHSTLEILELRTEEGDRAYPGPTWASHKLTLEKLSEKNLRLKW